MKRYRIFTALMLVILLTKTLVWGQVFPLCSSTQNDQWVLHNPDDNRKTLFIAPWSGAGGDWAAQTQFRSNGDAVFSGKVGVGSEYLPLTSKLQVHGDFRTTTGRFSSIYSNNTDGLYPATYANTLGDAQLTIGSNWTGGMTDLLLINSNIANTSGGGFTFWQMTGGTSKKMLAYQNEDGSMGIVTQFPGAYKLAVEGKIGAREVEVKTGSWADFVFDNEYALPKLSEFDAHTRTNHHLPDMPSEAEGKKAGYGLGAIDVKLLQKIEELTLYVIQLQKEIDEPKRLVTLKK